MDRVLGCLFATRPGQGHLSRALALLLLACLVAPLSGCSCTPDPNQQAQQDQDAREKLKEKKKKPKPDFEIGRVALQPGDRDPNLWLKPGHWVGVSQPMQTNNFDFVGQLELAVVDRSGEPIHLHHTPYRLTTTRPAVLPKQQPKHLDMALFVPHASTTAHIASTLRSRYGGGEVQASSELFSAIPPYQYYFVVLSETPDRYTYLKTLDSVAVPVDADFESKREPHYRVVMPAPKKPLALPSQALTWTGTAYVLWDGLDATLLSPEQQQAILDWLHWGGQILISGPRSFDRLRGSFLEPYLPATDAVSATYDADQLAELNDYWTLAPDAPLTVTQPWSGVRITPHADAAPVPHTAELLWERRIGRGRIVLSAVHLNERDLVFAWRGFDNFFNATLLRRPPRRYSTGRWGNAEWRWADDPSHTFDAAWVSPLRYFIRDTGVETNFAMDEPEAAFDETGQLIERPVLNPTAAGGVAAWNSVSPVSNAAREALRRAAGIKIPKASFVLWVLAVYLVVLVPVNWLLFSALGRVEWAWVAAPVVSLGFALLVIRLAQLDIGFARSQTEVAVLEVQGRYPRAHLTRYTALYTSLSTTYDLSFASSVAVAQPLPVTSDFRLLPGQSLDTVTYRRWDDVGLEGLTVASNSTGMVHSEQMLDLGGPIRLGRATTGGEQIFNGSRFALEGAAVLRRPREGEGSTQLEGCWLGTLRSGESKPLRFATLEATPFAQERRLAARSKEDASLAMDELLALAQAGQYLEPGETRLVAFIPQVLAGAEITPAASQIRGQTLVVAHLAYGLPAAPRSDANSKTSLGKPPQNALERNSQAAVPPPDAEVLP